MKKLLIVAEYWDSAMFLRDTGKLVQPDVGNFFVADEVTFFCTRLNEMYSNVIVADPFRTQFDSDGNISSLNWSKGFEETFNIKEIGVLYFPMTCKKNVKADVSNDLTSNMKVICNFLESFRAHESNVVSVNSVETTLSMISKQYILDFIAEGHDFMIPTFEVKSIDELLEYANGKEGKDWIAKPMISERANHANVITDGSWDCDKLSIEYMSMLEVDCDSVLDSFKSVMSGQGVVVQEFQKGFTESGEIKVTVIGDEILHARRTIPTEGSGKYIAAKNGGFERHELSNEERAFVRKVVDVFNSKYKAHALRIDIIKDDFGDFLVSEIEAVNQSYAVEIPALFAEGELKEHFEKLIPSKYLE